VSTRTLLSRLREHIDAPSLQALEVATKLAESGGLPLYLVGGAVRDLLLETGQVDVDLVVEGDAIAIATLLAEKTNARLVTHPRFGTAVVRTKELRIDLASARAERYERPGVLPSVRRSTIDDDLARRDFTVNAMALRLTGPNAGTLLDPFGGRSDLQERRIRVLHPESFRDDPTRLLRAVRYAGRMGFEIERGTQALLRRDRAYLDKVSGARLRRELELIASEPHAGRILAAAESQGLLKAILPTLHVSIRDPGSAVGLDRAAVVFAVLAWGSSQDQAEALIGRLSLTSRQAVAVRGAASLKGRGAALAKEGLRPSEVVCTFADIPEDAVEALRLVTESALVRDRAARYLREWRKVRPRLSGKDLEAAGVPPGPAIGSALRALRCARLDGVVTTREQELSFAKTYARERTSHE
jgi:tRNA nucleotidyltransferase (CCA-adding enzyme)